MADLFSRFRRRSRPERSFASVQAESFRILRTNLEVSLMDLDRPSVMVTSPHPGEGKTETCSQLAAIMAAAGRRVVLVDLDLRKPDLHRYLGVPGQPGVTDVLLDKVSVDAVLQYVEVGGGAGMGPQAFYFLPAGTPVPNPSELLSTKRLGRLLDALSRQADLVLIDTPPALAVADTLTIGRLVGGAVLVVSSRDTLVSDAARAKDALIRNHTRMLGVVLNRLGEGEAPYGYAYGYGYGYGADSEPVAVTRS
jgi:capsular exopolysaccharide synthesis family protein